VQRRLLQQSSRPTGKQMVGQRLRQRKNSRQTEPKEEGQGQSVGTCAPRSVSAGVRRLWLGGLVL